MSTFIRHPKDFWSGIIFLAIGLAAIYIAQDYGMGTAGRMGPAYFPTALGSLLGLVGAACLVRSFVHKGDAIGKLYVKELSMVLAAVLLFGLLMRGAGLVPAAVVLVMLSAWASPKFHFGKAAVLAAGLALFAVVLFVKLLGLPMPIFGPWLDF
jgi:hypothetical protein